MWHDDTFSQRNKVTYSANTRGGGGRIKFEKGRGKQHSGGLHKIGSLEPTANNASSSSHKN